MVWNRLVCSEETQELFFPTQESNRSSNKACPFLFSWFMLLSSQWDGIINFVPFFKGGNCFDFPIGNKGLHECSSLYGAVNLVLRNSFPCFDLTSGKGMRFPRFTSVPLKSESGSCCFLELGDFNSQNHSISEEVKLGGNSGSHLVHTCQAPHSPPPTLSQGQL